MNKKKNSFENTTSQENSKSSRRPKENTSFLSRPLTPSELEALKKEMKESSKWMKDYLKDFALD